MTPIKTARLMRELPQTELAAHMGITPQALSKYESGERNLGPKLLPIAARELDVSEAYLSGCAQKLPVYDYNTGGTWMGTIMREESIPTYGVLYLVDIDELGLWLSVIIAGGVQFTLSDWQNPDQVMMADQIAQPPSGHWVDWRGNDAIMYRGLPCVFL